MALKMENLQSIIKDRSSPQRIIEYITEIKSKRSWQTFYPEYHNLDFEVVSWMFEFKRTKKFYKTKIFAIRLEKEAEIKKRLENDLLIKSFNKATASCKYEGQPMEFF